MWLGDLGTAVGDRGEALESKDRQRDRCHEAGGARVSTRRLERQTAGPKCRNTEQRDAAHLQYGHDDGNQPDRTGARGIHEIGNDDQPDAQNRNKNAVGIAAERP
jgi:hypothetical protein